MYPQNESLRRQRRRPRKNKRKSQALVITSNINLRSYPNQPIASHLVPCIPTAITTANTTGLLSLNIQIDPTVLVQSWATRFQTLYEEYRVIGAIAKIHFFSSVIPGVLATYWDEKTPFTAPVLADATDRSIRRTSLSQTDHPLLMRWTAKDLLDLQYTPIATSNPSVGLALFTNNANFGAPTVGPVAVGNVELQLHIQFRGFSSPEA